MPHTDQGLPFASGSHTSWKAAQRQTATPRARARRGSKTRAYLELLYDRGPRTDHEAHAALKDRFGGAHTGIQSIRASLMQAGLVGRGAEERPSPYGAACHTWALTLAGRAAVQAMREHK